MMEGVEIKRKLGSDTVMNETITLMPPEEELLK